jgi:anti-sigma factor ChrR (cupin superfamily)
VHFDGGPACAAADCGFVRLAAGTAFPLHTHAGEEVSLIIAGSLKDRRTGRTYAPGDELVEAEHTEHDVVALDAEVIYAARATNGIVVAGTPARPKKS